MAAEDNRAGQLSALERTTRITTGLILMSFACTHFLSHATGLFLLDPMEKIGRDILMAPWRSALGRWTLLIALLTHMSLGLWALYRRRHLRLPTIQKAQLWLALSIPLLLIPHLVDTRLADNLYGIDPTYYRILYKFWITSPAVDLTRQFLLLLVLWTHGCIGLHMWLRHRRWYARWSGPLLAIVIAIPALAVAGIMNAGWDLKLKTLTDSGFAVLYGMPKTGSAGAQHVAMLARFADQLQLAYIGFVAAIFAARATRHWHNKRRAGINLRYLGQKTVTVPRGFSILEASHFRGIPHVSLCGGKARCSTCRVRIIDGLEALPPPNAIEAATLQRIEAPDVVRLACQTRPLADLALVPLVPVGMRSDGLSIAYEHGDERVVTALAIDLRDSTGLAAGKLPFDTLFIINHFINVASSAIEAHGGYITSVAGDGIMSVFGLKGAAEGARQALAAAHDIWAGLEKLNHELVEELRTPLRFGMGIHSGLAIVGAVALSGRSSMQFLGDTGNVASRLETASKDFAATVVVSEAVFSEAGLAVENALPRASIAPRGREMSELHVVLIRARGEIAAHLDAIGR